ncbi:protein of unknown function [Pseudomonas mediterranea]
MLTPASQCTMFFPLSVTIPRKEQTGSED